MQWEESGRGYAGADLFPWYYTFSNFSDHKKLQWVTCKIYILWSLWQECFCLFICFARKISWGLTEKRVSHRIRKLLFCDRVHLAAYTGLEFMTPCFDFLSSWDTGVCRHAGARNSYSTELEGERGMSVHCYGTFHLMLLSHNTIPWEAMSNDKLYRPLSIMVELYYQSLLAWVTSTFVLQERKIWSFPGQEGPRMTSSLWLKISQ